MSIEDVLSELRDSAKEKLRETDQPERMDPMLATLTHDHFSNPDWIYERKLDGERCLVFRDSDSVRLMSRNENTLNVKYPELVDELEDAADWPYIVDGEIVALDEDGISSFERLQSRLNLSSVEDARKSEVDVYLYLFDILYLGSFDTTQVPQIARKQLLKRAIKFSDKIRYVEHKEENGEAYFAEACKKGWEGIIAKKADGVYRHSRSQNWLKFKCVRQQELVIGGYTKPHGDRIGFGALLLGYYEQGSLRYAGKVGTGFDDATLQDLYDLLSSLERKTPPFDEEELPDAEVTWVTPKLVAEIGFEEWTKNDKLRQPRYLGLRQDKPAKDVVKEA